MLVELCVSNYVTFDVLVSGVNVILKTSMTYNEKTIMWIMFQNFKIGTLIREKINRCYVTTLNKNGHQLNLLFIKKTLIRPNRLP